MMPYISSGLWLVARTSATMTSQSSPRFSILGLPFIPTYSIEHQEIEFFSRYQKKFFVKCEMYQTVFFAVVKPVTRPSGSDDPLQLVGLDPNDFVYSFVAPQLKTLERPRFTNWIHSMIYIDRLIRMKCTSLPSSIARPVTQRKMSPSSWRIGILNCLISSSDKVP